MVWCKSWPNFRNIIEQKKLGEKFKNVAPAEKTTLPPPGPYNPIIEIANRISKFDNIEEKTSNSDLLRATKDLKNTFSGNSQRVSDRKKKNEEKKKQDELLEKKLMELLGIDSKEEWDKKAAGLKKYFTERNESMKKNSP